MLKAIQNTIANFVGGLTAMAATLVFNAIYYRVVDDEVFGIISLLLTATLVSPALDVGTGRTAGRAIAQAPGSRKDIARLRDVVATLQIANATIGLLLGLVLAMASPIVAVALLKPQNLATSEVAWALVLIAGQVALMLPRHFATACLNGMKRQILANVLLSGSTLIRGFAGLLALLLGDDPLQAFLVVQGVVWLVDALVCVTVVWRLMPPAHRRARFDTDVLRSSWRFAGGDGAAVLIGTLLAHGDRLLLAALLPLSSYGAYALVSAIASAIGRFTGPFSAAFLPHFVELTAKRQTSELREDYLVSTQLLSCVVLPMAAVMIFFAPEIVSTVVGPHYASGILSVAFAFLVAGTMLNNLMHLPHAVQLAAGNSATALRFTVFNAAAYVALILLATPRFGLIAPAVSLFSIYALTIVFFTRVTNRMLGVASYSWACHSIVRPGIGTVAVATATRVVAPSDLGTVIGAAWLVFVAVSASAAALALSPRARGAIRISSRAENRRHNAISG